MTRWLLALSFYACGGQLDPGKDADETGTDAMTAVDATALDVPVLSPPDASTDATSDSTPCTPGPCTTPKVVLSIASDNMQCKYMITWTCGTTTYEVDSLPGAKGCDPTFDMNRGFHGMCSKCGMPTGKFDLADPSGCTCFDTSMLAALAAKECGFPQ